MAQTQGATAAAVIVTAEAKKIGIENTKEALCALNMLALLLVDRFRDGIQMSDGFEIWKKFSNDKAFHDAMVLAYEGISQVNAEILDLDPTETMSLVAVQLQYIPQILDVLKSKETPAK